jgi:exonuclease SbcC
LRIEFKKVKGFDFVVDEHSLNCPTCNRPQENSAEIQEKQKADFNARKVIKIGELNKKGLALSKELKELESFVSDVSKIEKEILTVKNEFKNLKENVVNDFVEEPLKEDLLVKKMMANYKKKILEFEDADTKRAEYVEELKTLQIQQIEILQAEKGKARIKELINEESTKSIEIAEIERRQDLLAQFVVAKVEAIQKNVDDKFKITTFKMFNTNINGGVEETCVALHNGVPFSDLNNAMKINVGLDIINALQKHYQVLAPIFIDNRESVSQIMKTDAQIINLRVSSKDKTLRIERKE